MTLNLKLKGLRKILPQIVTFYVILSLNYQMSQKNGFDIQYTLFW